MSLRILTPATNVSERLAEQIFSTSRNIGTMMSALGGAQPDALGLAAPHPVFNLGLDAIDAPDWISKVQMTGWRYFVTSGASVVAASEASTSGPEGAVKGTLTNEGPFVLGTEEALAICERSTEVSKGNFVLGMLRVPALYVVALWLRNDAGSDELDRFVPAAPTPTSLEANAIMTPSDFIDALRNLKASKAESGSGSDSSN